MATQWVDVDDISRESNQHEKECKVDVIDANQMCRICAEVSNDLVAVFGENGVGMSLIDKIHTHLPIKITEQDPLPLHCCSQCIEKLNICHELVHLSLDADWTMRSWLECGRLSFQPEDSQEELGESTEEALCQDPLQLNVVTKTVTKLPIHKSDTKMRNVLPDGNKKQIIIPVVENPDDHEDQALHIDAHVKVNKKVKILKQLASSSSKLTQSQKITGNIQEGSSGILTDDKQTVVLQATNYYKNLNHQKKCKVVLVKLKNSETLSKAVQVEKALEIVKNKQEAGKLPEAKGVVPKRLQKKLLGLKTYGLLKLNKSICLPLEPNDYQIEDHTTPRENNNQNSSFETDSISCTFCGELFLSDSALNSHMSASHQNILYCYCSKTFETQETLDEHLKSHLIEPKRKEKNRKHPVTRNQRIVSNLALQSKKHHSHRPSHSRSPGLSPTYKKTKKLVNKDGNIVEVDFSGSNVLEQLESEGSVKSKPRVVYNNISESTILCESIIASAPKLKMWRCKVCGLVYPNEKLWLIHCQDVHFRCHFCPVELRSAREQQQHEKRHKVLLMPIVRYW